MLDNLWGAPHAMRDHQSAVIPDLFLLGNRYHLRPEVDQGETEELKEPHHSDSGDGEEDKHTHTAAEPLRHDSAASVIDTSTEIESTYVDFASLRDVSDTTNGDGSFQNGTIPPLSAENGLAEVSNSSSIQSNNNGAPHGAEQLFNESISQIKTFFGKLAHNGFELPSQEETLSMIMPTIEWPEEFLTDLNTKIWFTYRYGFPLIERDKNGPNPLSLGSFFRGTLDLNNLNKGFTTDSGWGCMIRTSQSLLANALLILRLGRNWRLYNSSEEEMKKHWEIVQLFADVPEAQFSIHNFVFSAARYCGRKPGEWFGPSNAAKSIQHLCNDPDSHLKPKKSSLENKSWEPNLKVYVSTDSGDIFEDEIIELFEQQNWDPSSKTNAVLILCGVRLGVKSINKIYWDFFKLTLNTKYSVGIAGGRPSSSHYFLGFQNNSLFYMDPHLPQPPILLNDDDMIPEEAKAKLFETIHTSKVSTLEFSKTDPSMLIGFMVQTIDEFNDFKTIINSFDPNTRFLNVCKQRPIMQTMSSAGSELEGFIDLGVESMNEEDDDAEDNNDDNDDGYEEAEEVQNGVSDRQMEDIDDNERSSNEEEEISLPRAESLVDIKIESQAPDSYTILQDTVVSSFKDTEEPIVELPPVKEVIVLETEIEDKPVESVCTCTEEEIQDCSCEC